MRLVISLFLVASSAFAAVPEPTAATFYPGKMPLTGSGFPAAWAKDVGVDTQAACRNIHRALYLIETRFDKIREVFTVGINFKVLFANRAHYASLLARRYQACTRTGVSLYRYGRCGTERETLAFVRVTLGFVHSTINLCDEYFKAPVHERQSVMVHEFGRLENIGDSPNKDTNSIYVWDAIVGRLSDDLSYYALLKP